MCSQHFKLLVDEIHVRGEGKVKNAMKESFKVLNEVCPRFISNIIMNFDCIKYLEQIRTQLFKLMVHGVFRLLHWDRAACVTRSSC